MREIKFRVWYSGRMLDVGKIEFFDNAIHVNDELVVKPENIMQFTGLKDKNGKEIYEGDIVTSSWGENYLVIWEGSGWKIKSCKHKTRPNALRGVSLKRKICGNQFENPNLL